MNVPRRWAAIVLVVLPALAYLPTLGGTFLGDDVQITHGAHLREADGWKSCLRESYHFPFLAERNEYRPLSSLSFWLQVRTTGPDPRPFHLVNLLLHLAVVVVFRGLLRRLLDESAAFAGALIFGIHPLFSEAVSLIAGRADLLSTLFALLAWRLHLRRGGPGDEGALRRVVTTVACVACLVLSVFSKESGVTAVGALLVTDLMGVSPGFRDVVGDSARSWWSRLRAVLGANAVLWLSLPIAVAVRIALRGAQWYQHEYSLIDNPLVTASWAGRWATALWVMVKGWILFLWPVSLSTDYSYDQIPVIRSLSDPRLWLTLAVIAGVGIGAWRAWRAGWRVPAWGLASHLCLGLATSNLLVVIGTIMAERLLYLPGLMLAAVSGAVAARLLRMPVRVSWRLAALFLVIVAATLGLRTLNRSFDWTSREQLARRQQEVAPRSIRTWKQMANVELERGDLSAALAAVERAREISEAWSDVWMVRSEVMEAMGRRPEALESVRRALLLGETSTNALLRYAALLEATGHPGDAVAWLRQVLTSVHGERRLHEHYVFLLQRLGRRDEALAHVRTWGDQLGDPIYTARLLSQLEATADP
ncbi:MAG: DUF1736 domain-containing protein [bacterium]|nr:DUF1736 domain-containing protein [bacterium]